MAANQLQADMFLALGGSENPGGSITSVYSVSNIALRNAVSLTGLEAQLSQVDEIMRTLRQSVASASRASINDSLAFGRRYANTQLDIYNLPKPGNPTEAMLDRRAEMRSAALQDITERVDTQHAQIRALLTVGGEEEIILGNEEHKGVLRDSSVIPSVIFYISTLLWNSFDLEILHANQLGKATLTYLKQAISVLDKRTTECCLRVHGQTQRFDTDFLTTGIPAYADRQEGPPFHARCRTAIVLYNSIFDFGLTQQMQDNASWILSQRNLGKDPNQEPADAFFPH